ncbi:hypothetical protein [Streptomyces sp. NPDC053079]|uniref:hypothetical protein n=1 Tax=Streptomyces sp. NPDC053079 TaxID=3365697 RepID=UPI0037D26183
MPPDRTLLQAVSGAAPHWADRNIPRHGPGQTWEVRYLTTSFQGTAFLALLVVGLMLIFSPDAVRAAAATAAAPAPVVAVLAYVDRSCLRCRRPHGM